MTSATLLVLFLAHACSIFGTASEQEADHKHIDTNMPTHNPNQWTNRYKYLDISNSKINSQVIQDEIYTENDDFRQTNLHSMDLKEFGGVDKFNRLEEKEKAKEVAVKNRVKRDKDMVVKINRLEEKDKVKDMAGKNRVKRDETNRCSTFRFDAEKMLITHPYNSAGGNKNYFNNSDCTAHIDFEEGHVIELTFVDTFRIEYHPDCAYDYLEIRDGKEGYSDLLGKVCGPAFPRAMKTTGPHAWLKFHSDDTIEYEGFNIKVTKIKESASYSIPAECIVAPKEAKAGVISSNDIDQKCRDRSASHGLDVLWKIITSEDSKIFLNFTEYELKFPNDCEKNGIQIFGSVLELSSKLEHYCGSVANPVITKADKPGEMGNVMNIRLYTNLEAMGAEDTKFEAKYTAFRSISPSNDEDACHEDEFNCADNTCIALELKCNSYADCRLKTDEDPIDVCKNEMESPFKKLHILIILIIFVLIMSSMMFVFLFKCIRKLYQDHKIIKEHIRQSCEDRLDRLDSLMENRLTLDAKRLQRDSEPRASLERENHANEMFKRKRDSFSKRQPTSIDSDFQETHIDLDEEIWRREVETQIDPEDILIERNGRTRRRDMSKKEESIRSKRESEERKEIKDVSIGAPDTKESGCQTRESLFQTDPPPSSDGKSSSSNSRGFSTFGYSGATIVRPSPPTNTSEITIELLKQTPRQESTKPQKKIDRRPMSTETTRSAPDVIIVSKPIR